MTQLNISLPPPKDSPDFDGWMVQVAQYLRDYLGLYDSATPTTATQAEMEAGTVSSIRKMTPIGVRQAIDYNQSVVDLRRFGVVGNGTTDDSGAINDAIDFIRSENASANPHRMNVISCAPYATYLVEDSINMTQLQYVNVLVEGNNSTLVGKCSNYPVIDMLGSNFIKIRNLIINGDTTNRPSDGILYGRGISGTDAQENFFENIFFYGNYTNSCMSNLGSEISTLIKCHLQNGYVGGPCYVADARNTRHITSQFFTVTLAEDTLASLNDNLFLNCTFEQIGTSGGPAVVLKGTTNRFKFDSCYAQHHDDTNALCGCFLLEYDHNSLHIDCHCEPPTTSVRNVVLQTSSAAMTLRDFFLREYYAFGTGQVINNNYTTAANFISSKIVVMGAHANIPVFGATGVINYHGEICIGDNAYLANFSNLNSLRGIVHSGIATASHTWPSTKSLILNSSVNGVSTI